MEQQFLIESNSNFHHSNYSKYPKHKIYHFFLFNIIIFISLFSSFFSYERKIKIVIAQNNESKGDMHIINDHGENGNKRKCPSTICENSICQTNSCNINLSEGSHIVVVEWNDSVSFNDCSNMFDGKTAITEIDLSEFYANNIEYMAYMFKGCISLQKVILPNITENKLLRAENMFEGCISLTNVTFSENDFKTEKVQNMRSMFLNCNSLSSINFPSNFLTSDVNQIQDMFSGCYSLTSLDFNILKTQNVTNMACLFKGTNLTSFNLNNFDTSKVTDTEYMFYNCSNLISLNLSKFDYTITTQMRFMLANNHKLELVDFGKSEILENADTTNMFENSNKKMIIYVNKKNPKAFFIGYNQNFTIVECGNLKPDEIKKNFIENKIVCVEKCSNLTEYKYKYNNTCLKNCPPGTIKNEMNLVCEINETISTVIPIIITTSSIIITTNITIPNTTIPINQITTTPLENPLISTIHSAPLENTLSSTIHSTPLENPLISTISSTELKSSPIPKHIYSTNIIEETKVNIITNNEKNMTNIINFVMGMNFFQVNAIIFIKQRKTKIPSSKI